MKGIRVKFVLPICMRYLIVIPDGMADEPCDDTGWLFAPKGASVPNFEALARECVSGRVATTPPGFSPGSDVAILSILGCHPDELPTGRAPLEASGLGMDMDSGQRAARRFTKADETTSGLAGFRRRLLRPGIEIVVGDGRINTLSGIDSGSVGKRVRFPSLRERFGIEKSRMVGYVPLVRGIARELGMEIAVPQGATGDTDTDYRGKWSATCESLETSSLTVLHIEACDAASHRCDRQAKIAAIEAIDATVGKGLRTIAATRKDVGFLLLPDHGTIAATGRHSPLPVRFLMYKPGVPAAVMDGIERGDNLLKRLIE